MVGRKERKQINDSYKLIKLHLFLCNLLTIAPIIIIGPAIDFQNVINHYFNDVVPIQWQLVLEVAAYFEIVYLIFTVTSNLHLFMYYMLNLNIQFLMLNHYISNICKGFPKDKDDPFYQDAIYDRLIFCIRHHIKLKRWFGCDWWLLSWDTFFVDSSRTLIVSIRICWVWIFSICFGW